jgi:RHH-type proline utilization regulon transcriptional repressor/proline dehydrogenase/delta 1-pyrroline-5-carboxylate dehydrogenase
MVGAVVGVQPFGGEGLSGTGPKAGGPLYLYRLLSGRHENVLARVFGTPERTTEIPAAPGPAALLSLARWSSGRDRFQSVVEACERFSSQSRTGQALLLAGPTGERNVYRIVPRTQVLCLANDDRDRLVQLAAVLAVQSRAIWPAGTGTLLETLPAEVQAQVSVARDWTAPEVTFDAVLLHGSVSELGDVQRTLSGRDGPIVGVERLNPGETTIPLERLVLERALSINTAAAGGNASLMTLD